MSRPHTATGDQYQARQDDPGVPSSPKPSLCRENVHRLLPGERFRRFDNEMGDSLGQQIALTDLT